MQASIPDIGDTKEIIKLYKLLFDVYSISLIFMAYRVLIQFKKNSIDARFNISVIMITYHIVTGHILLVLI